MSFLDVTHIAVRVPAPLQEAERYYRALFELSVSWREPVPDGLEFDCSWDDLGDVEPQIVMLHSGAFRLSVESASGTARASIGISHAGLQVDRDTLDRVLRRVHAAGLKVIAEREGELLDFVDAFGIEWELDTRSFADPRAILRQKRDGNR